MKPGLFLLLLTACPAEQLGVNLPAGGIESMSNEDLKRDVWGLSRGALSDRRPGRHGHEAGLQFIGERLQSMHTLPAFGDSLLQPAGEGFNLCTIQKGEGLAHILITTKDSGVGAYESASGVAGLISLAKSFDVRDRPAQSLIFCVIAGDVGVGALDLNPVVPPESVRATFKLGPMGVDLNAQEKSPDPKEDLDFRILLDEIRQIRVRIDEALKP
jgi:hypothetical protein